MTDDFALNCSTEPGTTVLSQRSVNAGSKQGPTPRLAVAVRVASHIAVWLAVIVPTAEELSAGWRPMEDNAAIAVRAYQSLSLHPPLVGQATAASGSGHTLFDPGPLLFYLLAIPVHINPTYGILIGAMLLVGIVLSVAIEAAWSVGQWAAGGVVALTVLDLLWLMPLVFQSLPWNAFFPLPFFISSLVLAWVVCLGRVGWWPVLVATASIAGQSHLLFLIPGLFLVAVAGIFGLLETGRSGGRALQSTARSWGWLVVGLGVGLVCWLAPLIQNLGRQGNLSALVDSGGQPTLGIGFGLRQIGQAFAAPPLWMTRLPSSFFSVVHFTDRPQPWSGGLVLGLLVLTTVVALASGRRELGTLGAVATATVVSFISAFAIYPAKNAISLGYLINAIWILSILVWCVLLWGVVSILRVLAQRLHLSLPRQAVSRAGLAGTLIVGSGILVAVGLWSVSTSPAAVNWNVQERNASDQVTMTIEHQVPRGPVNIRVDPSELIVANYVAESVAFRLLTDGWSPGLGRVTAAYTGLTIPKRSRAPTITITVGSQGNLRAIAPG